MIKRISVMKGDKDFVRDGQNYTVTIDGVKQRQCITADAEKGMILRYKETPIGTLCVDRKGKFVTEVLYGLVEITRKEPGDNVVKDVPANFEEGELECNSPFSVRVG